MQSLAPPLISDDFVFEGPEKKLEVYFSRCATSVDGLRQIPREDLVAMLDMAACSILHHAHNEHFDAYLLSESSCFVFADRVILKTCGTTTLLLVLPKLFEMAESLGMDVELLQYGHLRYKFPDQQVYPHTSFKEEASFLAEIMGGEPTSTGGAHFGEVNQQVLGPRDGCCWYMLAVERLAPLSMSSSPPISPREGGDILEIAMEGMSAEVRECFGYGSSGPYDRAAAQRMTLQSGLSDALPEVVIDDWAFEPCGYSMNGLRDGFYYTVHVTPEPGFSYSSFETNDPSYRSPQAVKRIVSIFSPREAVVSLTSRRLQPDMPDYDLPGYERSSVEVKQLGSSASSVCCVNFVRSNSASKLEVAEDGGRESS